ncbi:MAG: hypothetical protein ACRBN8_33125 [Nannocystales bacterium]
MSARVIAVGTFLLCGCATQQTPPPPTVPPVSEPVEVAIPEYDPVAVGAGVYRLDLSAGLDTLHAALTEDNRAEEAAEVRDELKEGNAWLVLDPGGETLLLYGPQTEAMEVEVLSVAVDTSGFGLTLQDHPDRGGARCRAVSEVRLECDFEFDGGELQAPLPLVFERENSERPGLPAPGLYGWEPALGVEEVADVESIQDSLVSSGVEPGKARTLAGELMSRPSLNIVAGDSLWTLNNHVTWWEHPSQAEIKRGVFPLARMETTPDGFRIERRMPERTGVIVEDCRLMDAGFACRSGGRESIYERRTTPPAK